MYIELVTSCKRKMKGEERWGDVGERGGGGGWDMTQRGRYYLWEDAWSVKVQRYRTSLFTKNSHHKFRNFQVKFIQLSKFCTEVETASLAKFTCSVV